MKDTKKERNHKSYLYAHALAHKPKFALNKIRIKQLSGVNFMDFKGTLLISTILRFRSHSILSSKNNTTPPPPEKKQKLSPLFLK